MKLVVEINLDNAAFSDRPSHFEVARILTDYANKLIENDGDGWQRGLKDINGNAVGFTKLVEEED
jgi:hypothetical protein